MDEKLNSVGTARVQVTALPPPPPPLPAPPVPPVQAPSQPASSSNVNRSKEDQKEKRLRFTVELRPEETTIVSWKRLVKDSGGPKSVQAPKGDVKADLAESDPSLQPAPSALVKQGEDDPVEGVPQTNRFSSVIEKIERLYMGRNSSDEEEELDVPDDDQYDTEDSFIDDTELDEYFQADNLVTKHTGYFVNKGKLEQIEQSAPKDPTPKKRRRKDLNSTTRVHSENDYKKVQANPSAPPGENKRVKNKPNLSSSHKRSLENFSSKELPVLALESRVNNNYSNNFLAIKDKGVPANSETNKGRIVNGEKEPKLKKEKKSSEFPEPSTSGSIMKTPIGGVRERPKGSRLDRAIRDLEKIVAECRPQSTEVQVPVDPANPVIKRRLPQDVKVKLAKVARLSAGQDKVSEEQLMDRLMGILGHIVQRKTLKRNIKEMVELGLSAKQVKADRFQQIKKEINEMIKSRISSLKSKVSEQQQIDGSADDFQEIGYNSGAIKGKFTMDISLEDKICDLYDLYVEGMDEDKGPQSRKLYMELAELWPYGYMDNVGIKDAISRAKDRKRALFHNKKGQDEDRLKRKKISSPKPNTNNNNANTAQAIVPYEKPVPNPSSSSNKTLVADPTASYPDYYQHNVSKKLKRKLESDLNSNPNSERVSKEKQIKTNKHSSSNDEANVSNNNNKNNNNNNISSNKNNNNINNNNESRASVKGLTGLTSDEGNLTGGGGVNFN